MLRYITAALCSSELFLKSDALEVNDDLLTASTGIDPNCTQTLSDGGTLTVYYNDKTDRIEMHVTIPKGSYAGFGWGASMENTEMVIFSTKGDTGSVETYYSPGFDTPNAEPKL